MLKKKNIIILCLLFLLGLNTAMANAVVDHTSILNGKVISRNLVQVGQTVSEGQVLLYVEGLSGSAPAARAKINGTVQAVLVKPGDTIKSGQVVVKIKS